MLYTYFKPTTDEIFSLNEALEATFTGNGAFCFIDIAAFRKTLMIFKFQKYTCAYLIIST